ncbi:endonuclease/exonuclease/phosphatase family protein [Ochrovirga pacifica]|uniref:endonuclease/exonuclease/phosphatase family protein n=1 Tax=Ochrovirga pacifica TaxID=1042376 RepID=UPI000255A837|nr:endonuclease/exonuclease/phosphatase family protein [Ochrovirga pacifica]
MQLFLLCATLLFLIFTGLPLVKSTHWFFRIADFASVHLYILFWSLVPFELYQINKSFNTVNIFTSVGLLLGLCYLSVKLWPYFPFQKKKVLNVHQKKIKLISANVYQYNTEYQLLIDLLQKEQPDIFITIETNKDWEKALTVFDESYPYHRKVSQENTYGMHFYSKIPFDDLQVHYFVADDIPSMEAHFTLEEKNLILYAVHPPPASPTEESNSKEQEGELMSIAKKSVHQKESKLVVGDFNSVSWARSTRLFAKLSQLKDARKGLGFISTFPAKYSILKIPIDLAFHTPDIQICQLKTLSKIGSDHLPLFLEFCFTNKDQSLKKTHNKKDLKEQEEMIQKGKETTSENRS